MAVLLFLLVAVIGGVAYGVTQSGKPSGGAPVSASSHKNTHPTNTSPPTQVTGTTAGSSATLSPTSPSVIQSSRPGTIELLDNGGNGANNSYVTQNTMQTGPIAINSRQYPFAAYGYGSPRTSTPGEIDFNLSRTFKTFTARIGVVDTSPAACTAEIQVITDGKTVIDGAFSLGQSQDLSISVTGVLRLQVVVVNSANLDQCYGGLGNPNVSP